MLRRSTCSASEFEGLVQRNLAASCSFSYADMAGFLCFLLRRVLGQLLSGSAGVCSRKDDHSSGPALDPCSPTDLQQPCESCSMTKDHCRDDVGVHQAPVGQTNGIGGTAGTSPTALQKLDGTVRPGCHLCHDGWRDANGVDLEHAVSLQRLLQAGNALLHDMQAQEAAVVRGQSLDNPACTIWDVAVLNRLRSALQECHAGLQVLMLDNKVVTEL